MDHVDAPIPMQPIECELSSEAGSISRRSLLALAAMGGALAAGGTIGTARASWQAATIQPKVTHLLLVFSNPVPGKEKEYEEWYANIHMRDQLNMPGFISARQFRVSDAQLSHRPDGAQPQSATRYLVVYEISTDDLKATLDTAVASAHAGHLERSPVPLIEASTIWSQTYTAVTPRVTEPYTHN